jgi:hypothetical protein
MTQIDWRSTIKSAQVYAIMYESGPIAGDESQFPELQKMGMAGTRMTLHVLRTNSLDKEVQDTLDQFKDSDSEFVLRKAVKLLPTEVLPIDYASEIKSKYGGVYSRANTNEVRIEFFGNDVNNAKRIIEEQEFDVDY